MYAPTPVGPRHILACLAFAIGVVLTILMSGCGSSVAAAYIPPSIKEIAAGNAVIQLDLETAKAKAKQSAAEAIAAKLAKVTSDAKATDAEKAAAEARAEAQTARGLADQALSAAKLAEKRAKELETAAEVERAHEQIVAAQATCHWIAGILTLIAVLATIDVVASFFITQISRTRGLAEGVAATGFAGAGVVMVIASLVPYFWWVGAVMAVVVAGGYLWHRHDSATKTEATGSAADALTTAALAKVKAEMGGDALHAMIAPIEAAWKKVWGGVKPLVDKVSHTP